MCITNPKQLALALVCVLLACRFVFAEDAAAKEPPGQANILVGVNYFAGWWRPLPNKWIGPDGNGNGWAAYRVADHVKKHEAWGVGVYSVFNRTKEFILLENGILTPQKGDIIIHYPFTVNLSNNGGIEHIINGLGGPHTSRESRTGSLKTLPETFNNVWRSN